MARHNREGRGTDQRGAHYMISYQPDWLQQIKVTRSLESGRQSTKTLFRNPAEKENTTSARIRTRITSKEQKLDFEIGVDDPHGVVTRIVVETMLPGKQGESRSVIFTIDDGNATT
ncbi:MAG: hypothetical protein ACRELX_10555 [Longimicrobiales bacterium]